MFANALLSAACARGACARTASRVLRHRLVPPSDGGLALGQLVVAARADVADVPTATPTHSEERPMCLAVPGKVLDIEERDGTRMATVDFGGVVKEVCLEYLPDLQVGEYAIVHVGFALQRLDEESARRRSRCSRNWACSRRSSATPGSGRPRQPRPEEEAATVKYIDEFQDPELARRLLDDIHATVTRPWALMEVCGGQTHSIIRHGIDQLLPGPGRADPRAGLPGLRHAAGGHRQGAGDRLPART